MRSTPIPPTTKTNTLAPASSTAVVTTTTTTNTTSVASPWHSPVPYLFGGLAAIMALIALALFMLACSYWRLTRITQQESNNDDDDDDDVVKEVDDDSEKKEQPKVYEEKILVIMAGDHNPTFLATPSSSLGCSNFDHKHLGISEDSNKSQKEVIVDDHVVVSDAEHENGSFRHEQRIVSERL